MLWEKTACVDPMLWYGTTTRSARRWRLTLPIVQGTVLPSSDIQTGNSVKKSGRSASKVVFLPLILDYVILLKPISYSWPENWEMVIKRS